MRKGSALGIMTGLNLNPFQFRALLASVALFIGALAVPWKPIQLLLEVKLKILPAFPALARRRTLAVVLAATVAFAGDALVSWWKPPVPVVFDEFSYLLAADTFASGHLTNPTPAQWQALQTPEVLVRPSNQSKYPPGQAVLLAIGQKLTGNPLVGVWLSSALACAALCWMLQAWMPETWALYGSLLAAFALSFFGHWAQSYWGGMAAALGGALLYGAVRRIADGGAGWFLVRNALWLAFGVLILANTRPFEGLLAAAPAGAVLLALAWRRKKEWKQFAASVALPAGALLLLGGLAMLIYNQHVTGHAWQLPYQVYERQFDAVPSFIFQRLRPWPQLQDAAMEAAAVDTLAAWRWAHGFYRLVFITSKLFAFWQFVFGALLSLPFLLLVWAEPWSRVTRLAQIVAFAAVQGFALERYLFWPSPRPAWIVALLAALILQAGLLACYFRDFWDRVALSALALVALGLTGETWRFHSHYVAPVVPLGFVLIVQAVRRAWAWHRGVGFPGRVLALGIPVLTLALAAAASAAAPGPLERWAHQRAEMQRRLQSLPGRQLVIVHYGPRHDFYEEWVQNRADLRQAKVVWVRERAAEENCGLIAAFPGRAVWRLDADRNDLQPYAMNCGRKGVPSSSPPVLESLPQP